MLTTNSLSSSKFINTNASNPDTPKSLIVHKKRKSNVTKTSDWKKDGTIDLCITLYDKHASILEPYYSGSNTKELSMRRIDMCHTIATEITNYSQTKKAFNRIGVDRSVALKDCSLGMNIHPSTLILYSFIRKLNIIHVSGCLYFVTGDYQENEPVNENEPVGENISTPSNHSHPPILDRSASNTESNTDTNPEDAAPTLGTIVYHDKRYIANWTSKVQNDIFRDCVLVNNISKPLKSQHSYKLDELKTLYQKILWYNPNTNNNNNNNKPSKNDKDTSIEKMTKSSLYNIVQQKFERAAFDFKPKPPNNNNDNNNNNDITQD
jgi:hypothetical protein